MERKTRQQAAILDAIAHADRPLLAQEILARAACCVPHLSVATVYRHIKALQAVGTIRPVRLPGQNPRYELAASHRNPVHHHYFQCRNCARVFDMTTCPGNLDKLAPAGFMVEDHEIILYGLCSECVVAQKRSEG